MAKMPRLADQQLLAAVQAARASHTAGTPGPDFTSDQWDREVQVYLYLVAEFRTRQDSSRLAKVTWPEEDSVKTELCELRKLLAFPSGYNSPAVPNPNNRIAELIRSLAGKLSASEPSE
jgi:hypothetical protein